MNKKSILESLIFINQEPISIKKLAKVLEIKKEEVEKLVDELINELKQYNRGVRILKKEDMLQMVTAKENSNYVQKLIKSSLTEDLSQAAIETLTAIAYFGPLTRHEIENLRGVNCIFILRSLLIRGLIERQENPRYRSSYIYKVSFDFLKKLGLEKIEDLPYYEKFRKYKEAFLKSGVVSNYLDNQADNQGENQEKNNKLTKKMKENF